MFRASVSNLSSYYCLANLTLWWCGSVRSGTMSDFACWVGMGMKLSEWVGRHRSIWVGRSSTHFHNFTVACFWKLCWFGISDSMKCLISESYNESYATCLKFHWCASSLEWLELWWKQQQSKLIESYATRLRFHWISDAVSAGARDQPEESSSKLPTDQDT